MVSEIIGKGEIAGVTVVAGGILGNRGDVVLDSISHPTKVVYLMAVQASFTTFLKNSRIES